MCPRRLGRLRTLKGTWNACRSSAPSQFASRKSARLSQEEQEHKSHPAWDGFCLRNNAGDHLISHTVSRAVPSAQRGLTSVFGMGTGDPSQYGHRQIEASCGRLSPQPKSWALGAKDLRFAFDLEAFSRRKARGAGSLEPKSRVRAGGRRICGSPLILEALGGWLPAAGRDICERSGCFPGEGRNAAAIWRQQLENFAPSKEGADNETDRVTRLEECPLMQHNCAELILWTSRTGD